MVTQVVGAKTQWTAMTCSFDVNFLATALLETLKGGVLCLMFNWVAESCNAMEVYEKNLSKKKIKKFLFIFKN